jgi:UDP-N-acetyl-D-galactosamine dehydrogenase
VQEEYGLQLCRITNSSPVDSLVVAVAHTEFERLTPRELKSLCVDHDKVVIGDLKALFDRNALSDQGFEVFRF